MTNDIKKYATKHSIGKKKKKKAMPLDENIVGR